MQSFLWAVILFRHCLFKQIFFLPKFLRPLPFSNNIFNRKMLLKKLSPYHYVLVLLGLFSVLNIRSATGQEIENLRVIQEGDKIIIHYDFSAKNTDNVYQIKLYHSINGFSQPVSLARGDVGDRIRPGNDKRVEWYAREELGTYKGNLIVEIRVFLAPEGIYIQSPAPKAKIKRGGALNINWSGGINDDKVSISLIRDGKIVENIANNVANNGSYSWISTANIKPGKTYAVQISGTSTTGAQSTSSPFTIARKVPLWLLIAPVAVVGATVAIIISRDKGGENNNLPGAPDPN